MPEKTEKLIQHKHPETKWWSFKMEHIWKKIDSNPDGLEVKEIDKRKKQYGLNELPKKESETWVNFLINQIKSLLVIVLIIASIVSLLLGDPIDAGIIFLVVIINVIVGFWQEYKTSQALESLQKIVVHKAKVIRHGEEQIIFSKDLIPGDIVLLSAGDKIPADLRLFKTNNLTINEAILTGESEPREKKCGILDDETVIAERTNMAFMGTLVSEGNGRGVVVETGINTNLGRIATLVSTIDGTKTPLQKKLDKFAIFLTKAIITAAFLIFVIGLFYGHSIREMFTTSIAVAVSAIPEGLAITVTVVLAIGMQKILKQNAIVKHLLGAEILGSTNIICTDKTGTLTEGNMQVVKIITEDMEFSLDKDIEITPEIADEQHQVLQIATLCNDAYVAEKKDKLTNDDIVGSLTEKALLLAGINHNLDKEKLEKKYPRLDEIPFESRHKFMMTLNKFDDEHNLINLKGAPEKVLLFSNHVYSHKTRQTLEMNSYRREKIIKLYEDMSKHGLRVLAVGYKEIDKDVNSISNTKKIETSEEPDIKKLATKIRQATVDLYTNFTFVGLIGIKDPIRANVKDTIYIAKQAGLEPVIITGDNKFIARTIAKDAGISIKPENILEGEELESMTKTDLKQKVKDIKIYARTSPEQKLKIIQAWQANDKIVAMTGDGINDAPALKQANIGIALGTANDVAKESSDLILLDNNFKTILEAIKQGRVIFENIKKIVSYYLSDSFTEVLVIATALIFKWPLPILASQIIWVNLIDDGLPALALTRDPETHDVMQDKPVKQNSSVVDNENRLLIALISLIGALIILFTFNIFWQGQASNFKLANTLSFTLLAVTTLIYIFSIRDLKNPVLKTKLFNNKFLIGALLTGFSLQLLAIYNPFLQNIFQTTPLNFLHWLYVLGMSLLLLIIIEGVKCLYNKKNC